MILAGDVGGTNTRLALFDAGASLSTRRPSLATEVYPSRAHGSLEEIIDLFRATHPAAIEAASIAVAGPVIAGSCTATNLAWQVRSTDLARRLRLEQVGLLNDLAANALGIAALGDDDVLVVQAGNPEPGNAVVISAGTGLGEAALVWDGRRHQAVGTEGGHGDFAPRDELEIELLRYLLGRFGRVSYERVVSGPGLVNVYEFLRDTGRGEPAASVRDAMAGAAHPAAVIADAALERRCGVCRQALEMFLGVYGAEAGNLALKYLSTAGVWLGGGMIASIAPRLDGFEPFLEPFGAKGRMSPLVQRMPVKVILNPHAALLGAARHAASQLP